MIKSLPELPEYFNKLSKKDRAVLRRQIAVDALRLYLDITNEKELLVIGYSMGYTDHLVSCMLNDSRKTPYSSAVWKVFDSLAVDNEI